MKYFYNRQNFFNQSQPRMTQLSSSSHPHSQSPHVKNKKLSTNQKQTNFDPFVHLLTTVIHLLTRCTCTIVTFSDFATVLQCSYSLIDRLYQCSTTCLQCNCILIDRLYHFNIFPILFVHNLFTMQLQFD